LISFLRCIYYPPSLSQFALVFVHIQLVLQFAKDEGITLGEGHSAQVLLARDTRPTGEYLLDVATKVWY
jgi:hypothetical protein